MNDPDKILAKDVRNYNSSEFASNRDMSMSKDSKSWWVGEDRKVLDVSKLADRIRENHNMCKVNDRIIANIDGKIRYETNAIMGLITYYDRTLLPSQRKDVYMRIVEMIGLEKLVKQESLPKYIQFRNGVLNIETGEMTPASEHTILNTIPFDYNTEAYNEDVDKMLDRITCGDKALRSLIEEMVGYCMYRSLKFRKFFILQGGRRNGKSTLLDLIKYTLGKDDNVSSLSLSDYQAQFSRVRLFGMLANIGDDISDQFIKDTDSIKKLISGEAVKAEEKGQPVFFFNSYATSIFSTNNIPKVADPTGALMDRMIVIPFNAYFASKDADLGLSDRIQCPSGAEYMILLGLKGLDRLLERGDFSYTAEVKELGESVKRENDSFCDWMADYDPLWRDTAQTYADYCDYCEENGVDKNFRLKKGSLVKKINATLMTWKHQYSNISMVIEPKCTRTMSSENIKHARAMGWTGRPQGAPNDTPAIIPAPSAVHLDSNTIEEITVAFRAYAGMIGLKTMDRVDMRSIVMGDISKEDIIQALTESKEIRKEGEEYVYTGC